MYDRLLSPRELPVTFLDQTKFVEELQGLLRTKDKIVLRSFKLLEYPSVKVTFAGYTFHGTAIYTNSEMFGKKLEKVEVFSF